MRSLIVLAKLEVTKFRISEFKKINNNVVCLVHLNSPILTVFSSRFSLAPFVPFGTCFTLTHGQPSDLGQNVRTLMIQDVVATTVQFLMGGVITFTTWLSMQEAYFVHCSTTANATLVNVART